MKETITEYSRILIVLLSFGMMIAFIFGGTWFHQIGKASNAMQNRAVIKALTKELQKAEQYDNNFLALSDKVEITSAKVENGVLKVEFSSDYTLDETLGSSTEDGLLNSLINTYGYNLGVDKVAIYFGNELYTGVKGELEPGYFKVDFSSAEIYS